MRKRRLAVALGVTIGLAGTMLAAVPAAATAPQTPHFGRHIDGYASYDGQDTCDPTEKPGPVALRAMLNRTYGYNRTENIGRSCNSGGRSEHKEGRALDYHLDVTDPDERANANAILDWLLATDVYGNKHANARRLGIMYMIWNRREWDAYDADRGWRPYTGTDNPHTDHIHFSFSWAGARKQTSWWDGGTVMSVYGILGDGRLTYSAIQSGTGNRIRTVTSTSPVPFVPKAMATLNFNTLLVTAWDGRMYRVDVISNNTDLTYSVAEIGGTGWTHDRLTFDGAGHLFGIAGGTLLRYTVTARKPDRTDIIDGTQIGTGFTLDTLAASGPNWIIGTSTGRLLSYHIGAGGPYTPYTLKTSGWGGFTHLMSPGAGIYLGRTPASGLYHYYDVSPFDGDGGDLTYYPDDPVDASGWTQTLLSAQPFTT